MKLAEALSNATSLVGQTVEVEGHLTCLRSQQADWQLTTEIKESINYSETLPVTIHRMRKLPAVTNTELLDELDYLIDTHQIFGLRKGRARRLLKKYLEYSEFFDSLPLFDRRKEQLLHPFFQVDAEDFIIKLLINRDWRWENTLGNRLKDQRFEASHLDPKRIYLKSSQVYGVLVVSPDNVSGFCIQNVKQVVITDPDFTAVLKEEVSTLDVVDLGWNLCTPIKEIIKHPEKYEGENVQLKGCLVSRETIDDSDAPKTYFRIIPSEAHLRLRSYFSPRNMLYIADPVFEKRIMNVIDPDIYPGEQIYPLFMEDVCLVGRVKLDRSDRSISLTNISRAAVLSQGVIFHFFFERGSEKVKGFKES